MSFEQGLANGYRLSEFIFSVLLGKISECGQIIQLAVCLLQLKPADRFMVRSRLSPPCSGVRVLEIRQGGSDQSQNPQKGLLPALPSILLHTSVGKRQQYSAGSGIVGTLGCQNNQKINPCYGQGC